MTLVYRTEQWSCLKCCI